MTSAPETAKWPGIDNHYLILEAESFIVFLDSDLDVDWLTSDKYDETGPKDPAKHNEILNYAAGLECIPNSHHKRNVRLNFKRMVGEGVARSLDHDYDSAEKMLERARQYIGDRNVETARFWQLSTGCALGLLFASMGLGMWTLRVNLIGAWGDSFFFLILSGSAGAIGAVLSMIFRMGRSFPTSEAPKDLHILEAASRVFAGLISGVLIAGAVRVGLVLPILGRAGQLHVGMLVAAMTSGASERLAPSLIAKLESDRSNTGTRKGKLE